MVDVGGGAQKGAHAALGVGRDHHQTDAGLAFGEGSVRQVGGHTIGQQVLVIEGTEFIVRDAARIEGFAAQLCQRHRGVAG